LFRTETFEGALTKSDMQ